MLNDYSVWRQTLFGQSFSTPKHFWSKGFITNYSFPRSCFCSTKQLWPVNKSGLASCKHSLEPAMVFSVDLNMIQDINVYIHTYIHTCLRLNTCKTCVYSYINYFNLISYINDVSLCAFEIFISYYIITIYNDVIIRCHHLYFQESPIVVGHHVSSKVGDTTRGAELWARSWLAETESVDLSSFSQQGLVESL